MPHLSGIEIPRRNGEDGIETVVICGKVDVMATVAGVKLREFGTAPLPELPGRLGGVQFVMPKVPWLTIGSSILMVGCTAMLVKCRRDCGPIVFQRE